jgi:translation initiation factor 1
MSPGMFAGTQWDREPHCARCDQPESVCTCPPEPVKSTFLPPEKQTARLSVEKRPKGKVATCVRGLAATATDLPALLTKLKNVCGSGGTLAEEGLELQGDQVERVRAALTKLGYRVKG